KPTPSHKRTHASFERLAEPWAMSNDIASTSSRARSRDRIPGGKRGVDQQALQIGRALPIPRTRARDQRKRRRTCRGEETVLRGVEGNHGRRVDDELDLRPVSPEDREAVSVPKVAQAPEHGRTGGPVEVTDDQGVPGVPGGGPGTVPADVGGNRGSRHSALGVQRD